MFGFGKRKRYNAEVDTKLNNEYGIATKDNPHFPEILSYLKYIDECWLVSLNSNECALWIATRCYCAWMKAGLQLQAGLLLDRMMSVGKFGVEKGMISEGIWKKSLANIYAVTQDFSAFYKESEVGDNKVAMGAKPKPILEKGKMKHYVNPFTLERVSTRTGDELLLDEWRREYGSERVEGWVVQVED